MTSNIAIIGAGISGLTAAYLLNRKCNITLFERETCLGGHTATFDFEFDGSRYSIDTGFIVYNDWTYPNFIKLLQHINIATQPTSMGFSVTAKSSGFEYAGNNVNTLFAQRGNVLSRKFWRMLKDIVRFNKQALKDLDSMSISQEMTLGEYLEKNGYSEQFSQYYLVPMGAAIWSASLTAIRQFPVHFFVEFFRNHGLLSITNRPQWRVIKGGSRQYIEPLIQGFKDKIITGTKIRRITRGEKGVTVELDGERRHFDQVVMATHSDDALELLGDASSCEKSILSAIPYSDNSVILHHDESLLPKRRRAWSSWNYLLNDNDRSPPIVTYNMNILQNVTENKGRTFCVTLNAPDRIDPQKVIATFRYSHPQFSLAAKRAQERWAEINGVNNTWYCGAYWANGFHEDGVTSALRVAEQFGEFL